MGAKLSKKGGKAAEKKEEGAEPALTTFDKTATLPASFRKRNVNMQEEMAVRYHVFLLIQIKLVFTSSLHQHSADSNHSPKM